MTNKELACGKAPKRTAGYGAQSMTNPKMKEFIEREGTEEAKKALLAISGPVSRGQLCVIFHMFRKGREEIKKGTDTSNKFRLTPSPNRSPVVSSGSSSNSNSSPNMKKIMHQGMVGKRLENLRIKKLRSMFHAMKGARIRVKEMMAAGPGRAVPAKSNKNWIVRPEYRGSGIMVRRRRPSPSKKSEVVPANNNGGSSRGAGGSSGSGSNRSQVSNYASNGENVIRFTNFQNLTAKRDRKKVKTAKASRFNKELTRSRVNATKKRSLVKYNQSRKLKFMVVPSVGNRLRRISTKSVVFRRIGNKAHISKRQLETADYARWRMYEKMIKNMPKNLLSRENEEKNKEIRATLANKLMQNALRNVIAGKIALLPLKSAHRIRKPLASRKSSPNSSASPTKKNTKTLLMQKLKRMSHRKLPQVNIAKIFEKSIITGRQVEATPRQTAENRKRVKELSEKYQTGHRVNKNSNSGSNTEKPVVEKKKTSGSGAMKSLRKK